VCRDCRRSSRPSRLEPHRHRRGRRSGEGGVATHGRAAQRDVDARIGCPDSPWPSHLPAKAVVREVPGDQRLLLLPQPE
jgi:hypothetical protein